VSVLLSTGGENLTSENVGKCIAALFDRVSFAVFESAVLVTAAVAKDEPLSFAPHAARDAARMVAESHLTRGVTSPIVFFFVIICIIEVKSGRAPVTAPLSIRSRFFTKIVFVISIRIDRFI